MGFQVDSQISCWEVTNIAIVHSGIELAKDDRVELISMDSYIWFIIKINSKMRRVNQHQPIYLAKFKKR